jgi:heparan-alpha-glucosaminide N-acetyltransferase
MSVPCRDLESARPVDRLLSLDVFRGLTILAMIFANELDMAMIQGVPWWMKHARFSTPDPDFITFVDVIAPAFLFIVGAAIPLAVNRRLTRGDSWPRLWAHILVRAASLMIIGIFMGNMRAADVLRNSNIHPLGISHATWSVLLLTSFILVWNDYPRSADWKRWLFVGLRVIGIGMLVYLAIVYRQDGKSGPMKLCWDRWYIVGMIGWAYLVGCIVYVLFRNHPAGVIGCLAMLIAMYIGDRAGVFSHLWPLSWFNSRVSLGTIIGIRGGITVAGLAVGMLFVPGSPALSPRARIRWMLVFALGLLAAGFLLRPVYGLSSPKSTPTFALYCCVICCGLLAFLYWLLDVRGAQRWASFTLPAGRNPLLPYFMAFMLHPLTLTLGVGWLNNYLNAGLVGIARTAALTAVLGILLTALLSRVPLRVRL